MRAPLLSTRRAQRAVPVLWLALALAAAACGTVNPPGGATRAPSTVTPATSRPAGPPATAPVTGAGTWERLPDAPIPATRFLGVGVWTGREMLVHAIVPDGAAAYAGVTLSYSPQTGAWRTLAPGPVPVVTQNNDVALWTGTEMLVIGLTNGAYNPATNTWRTIPRYNGPVGAVAVWTGRQAVLWGGGCCGGVTADGASYTPGTNSWQALPPSPLSARSGVSGAWTGTEVIIAGGRRPPQANGTLPGRMFADAAAYNPATRTWRSLPPMPQERTDATVIWDGTEVLYIGGYLPGVTGPAADGLAVDPATGRWRRLPPMESGRSGFAAVWTGRQALVWGGMTGASGTQMIPPHGVTYDPATDRWFALPMSPLRGRYGPVAVWTGRVMIVWGGGSFVDGAAFQPAT